METSAGTSKPSKVADPYAVRNRIRQRKEQLVEYIGDLLVPQTEGFDQVNLDMTFTYLNHFDLQYVDNISMLINMAKIYGLKQSEYVFRGMLATHLNSRRSRNAKSMDIFTTMITQNKQEFTDKTEKKQGFNWFGFGKKDKGPGGK